MESLLNQHEKEKQASKKNNREDQKLNRIIIISNTIRLPLALCSLLYKNKYNPRMDVDEWLMVRSEVYKCQCLKFATQIKHYFLRSKRTHSHFTFNAIQSLSIFGKTKQKKNDTNLIQFINFPSLYIIQSVYIVLGWLLVVPCSFYSASEIYSEYYHRTVWSES